MATKPSPRPKRATRSQGAMAMNWRLLVAYMTDLSRSMSDDDWAEDLEYHLWARIQNDGAMAGDFAGIGNDDAAVLNAAVVVQGGWTDGKRHIPLKKWEKLYQEWREKKLSAWPEPAPIPLPGWERDHELGRLLGIPPQMLTVVSDNGGRSFVASADGVNWVTVGELRDWLVEQQAMGRYSNFKIEHVPTYPHWSTAALACDDLLAVLGEGNGWWCRVQTPFYPGARHSAGFCPHNVTEFNGRMAHYATGKDRSDAVTAAAILLGRSDSDGISRWRLSRTPERSVQNCPSCGGHFLPPLEYPHAVCPECRSRAVAAGSGSP